MNMQLRGLPWVISIYIFPSKKISIYIISGFSPHTQEKEKNSGFSTLQSPFLCKCTQALWCLWYCLPPRLWACRLYRPSQLLHWVILVQSKCIPFARPKSRLCPKPIFSVWAEMDLKVGQAVHNKKLVVIHFHDGTKNKHPSWADKRYRAPWLRV